MSPCPDLPRAVTKRSSAVLADTLYVNPASTNVYYLNGDAWTQITSTPISGNLVATEDTLYCVEAESNTRMRIYAYNNGEWTLVSDNTLSYNALAHNVVYKDGQIYVLGENGNYIYTIADDTLTYNSIDFSGYISSNIFLYNGNFIFLGTTSYSGNTVLLRYNLTSAPTRINGSPGGAGSDKGLLFIDDESNLYIFQETTSNSGIAHSAEPYTGAYKPAIAPRGYNQMYYNGTIYMTALKADDTFYLIGMSGMNNANAFVGIVKSAPAISYVAE